MVFVVFCCRRDIAPLSLSLHSLRLCVEDSGRDIEVLLAPDEENPSWLPPGVKSCGSSQWKQDKWVRGEAVVRCLRNAMEMTGADVAVKLDCDVGYMGCRWIQEHFRLVEHGYLGVGYQHNRIPCPDTWFGMNYLLSKGLVERMLLPKITDRMKKLCDHLPKASGIKGYYPEDILVSRWARFACPNQLYVHHMWADDFPICGGRGDLLKIVRRSPQIELVHCGQEPNEGRGKPKLIAEKIGRLITEQEARRVRAGRPASNQVAPILPLLPDPF